MASKGGPTKEDARIFLKALQARSGQGNAGTAFVRPIILEMAEKYGIPEKRCLFLLDKWGSKGWYEYGTVIDGGWLTDEGMAVEAN
ncbi:hypothetical protein [Solidesulfovibrio sp.]